MKKKEDYIKYRIDKAYMILDDARLLSSNQRWISAMNRLYYACFYAVHALLLKHNIETLTHNGTKTKFFQEFIKTGIIEKEYGKLYTDLFVWRQEVDYSDFAKLDSEKVLPLINKIGALIKIIEKLL